MKTPQELMKRRKKVINWYPDCPFQIGDVLTLIVFKNIHEYGLPNGIGLPEQHADRATANFRDMQWWEERPINDMPEYVKDVKVGKIVVKVHKYCNGNLSGFFVSETNKETEYMTTLCNWIPATQAEYEAYQNTLKSNE